MTPVLPNRDERNGAIDRSVVEERWPDALVLFDFQASHIAEQDDVVFYQSKAGKRLHARSAMGRAHWDAAVGVWFRYACGVTSHPRRDARKYCVAPEPLDPPATTTATLTELIYSSKYVESIVDMYESETSAWMHWLRPTGDR